MPLAVCVSISMHIKYFIVATGPEAYGEKVDPINRKHLVAVAAQCFAANREINMQTILNENVKRVTERTKESPVDVVGRGRILGYVLQVVA